MKMEAGQQAAGKVPVNKIIPLSVVDGPGNRTSIFLQGCNIACAYCHNPETQMMCNGCGICLEQCPVQALVWKPAADGKAVSHGQKNEGSKAAFIDRKSRDEAKVLWDAARCVQCDTCIRVCPNFASPKIRYMDAAEVSEEVKRNIPFIRGITVSGGECTLYPEFLKELFAYMKAENLTCYIDSNGCVDLAEYTEMMELCDKVMLDVKAWDNEKFRRLTGSGNVTVKKNLLFLAKRHQLEEVRIVCLEPEVDVEAAICGIAETVRDYVDEFTLKLIAFRNHGVRTDLKGRKMPSLEQMGRWREIAGENGFSNIRIV